MSLNAVELAGVASKDRLAALAEALRVLDAGMAVVAPGETGALVIARAGGEAGAAIGRATAGAGPGEGGTEGAAWLAASAEDVLKLANRAAHRVVRALSPGPAVFHLRLSEAALAGALAEIGAPPRLVDDGERLRARVAAWSSTASAIAQRAGTGGGALVAWEPGPRDADGAARAADGAGVNVGLVLSDRGADARPARATHVELGRTGGVRVLREGAYEGRYVMKHAGLNVLVVCTGNTCRSPMAEAIARGLVERGGTPEAPLPRGVPVRFGSAGTGAAAGAPPAPEGSKAVKAMGYAPASCSSRPLTRQLIADADVIWAMTRSHLAGVLALDPSAAGKAQLLDPSGADVPDPVGMGQGAYDETAERLRRLIAVRLKELLT